MMMGEFELLLVAANMACTDGKHARAAKACFTISEGALPPCVACQLQLLPQAACRVCQTAKSVLLPFFMRSPCTRCTQLRAPRVVHGLQPPAVLCCAGLRDLFDVFEKSRCGPVYDALHMGGACEGFAFPQPPPNYNDMPDLAGKGTACQLQGRRGREEQRLPTCVYLRYAGSKPHATPQAPGHVLIFAAAGLHGSLESEGSANLLRRAVQASGSTWRCCAACGPAGSPQIASTRGASTARWP